MNNETNSLDAIEYKNGQKNNWRRTAWNRIKELCERSRGIVLYLPGSKDLDRAEALRRGFSAADLIAIESNTEVAAKLRSAGVNVINSDLKSVLWNWPSHKRVSAVIADLQSGYTDYMADCAFAWMLREPFQESVFLANMMRGRESFDRNDVQQLAMEMRSRPDTEYRDFQEAYALGGGNIVYIGEKAGSSPPRAIHHPMLGDIPVDESLKNRGRQLAYLLINNCFQEWGIVKRLVKGMNGMQTEPRPFRFLVLPSYRSSKKSPYFDSVVLKREKVTNHSYVKEIASYENTSVVHLADDRARSKISAALAIRTMRSTGKARAA